MNNKKQCEHDWEFVETKHEYAYPLEVRTYVILICPKCGEAKKSLAKTEGYNNASTNNLEYHIQKLKYEQKRSN